MMYLLFGIFLFWALFIANSTSGVIVGIIMFIVNTILIHRFMKEVKNNGD